MNLRLTWVLAAAAALSLVWIFASFISWLVLGAVLLSSNSVASLVVISAALRMAAIVCVKRLRTADLLVIIDILSLEIVSIPFLALASLFSGNPVFAEAIRQVLFAWPFALILVSPVYGIYKLATLMRDSASLSTVLPSTVMLYALLAIILTATTLTSPSSGLAGLSQTLVAVFLGGLSHEVAPPEVGAAGILLYVVLILYATTRGRDIRASLNSILILAVVGSLVALGWAFLATGVTDLASLAFGVPGVALAAFLWGVSRAH